MNETPSRGVPNVTTSGRPLTRDEVEAILGELGAWAADKQTRPLTRDDVAQLMTANSAMLRLDGLTGEQLPLTGIYFCDHLDLGNVDLAYADLSGTRLVYANLEGARLYHVNLSGALLSHANLRHAQLHDARLTSAWANNVDLEDAALYRAHLTHADLRFANLHRARLYDATFAHATAWRADLHEADLCHTDLRETDFWRANLRNADLSGANLQETNFKSAILEGTGFGVVLQENERPALACISNVCFDEVTWGPDFIGPEERRGAYRAAASVYRLLREAHHRSGLYDVADHFAYREQVARRKQALLDRQWPLLLALSLGELLFGYGYRWQRAVAAAIVTQLIFACVYWLGGLFGSVGFAALGQSLYFSVVSFTGLGYGPWITDSANAVKYLGALESLLGVFLTALFIATFTRRYMR